MVIAKGYSDFVLTGCAVLPAVALAFGQPEAALFAHIVLLFTGVLAAGAEDDAPFKQPERYVKEASPAENPERPVQRPGVRRTVAYLVAPLVRRDPRKDFDEAPERRRGPRR